METYSAAQKQRLIELNADSTIVNREFETIEERNKCFKMTEKEFIRDNKEKLNRLIEEEHIPLTLRVEDILEDWLTED